MQGFRWARIGAALMLLWALADNPYAYYQILRWVVCGVNGYAAYIAAGEKQRGWAWAFGVAAVLFNPIAPIHFERETWALLDVAVATFLLVSLFVYKPQPRSAVYEGV